MELTEQEMIEAESYWCEYCCNFDKEHIGMDGRAPCKITNTLAYSEESGKDCPFFNKLKSRFIELPCAVGDVVYPLNTDRRFRAFIERIEITTEGINFDWVQYDVGPDCTETWDCETFALDDIGKTVFLNEAEYLKAIDFTQMFMGVTKLEPLPDMDETALAEGSAGK